VPECAEELTLHSGCDGHSHPLSLASGTMSVLTGIHGCKSVEASHQTPKPVK